MPCVFSEVSNKNEIYEEQFKSSGASQLSDKAPQDALKSLEKLGISIDNPESFSKMDISSFLEEIYEVSERNFKHIFSYLTSILGVLILCAGFKNFTPTDKKAPQENVLNLVCSLCLSGCLTAPITRCIAASKSLILTASNFTVALGAVMGGIMIAAGKPISASAYQCLVLFSGQVVSRFSEFFLIPIMNFLFGISIISAVSTHVNLEKFCSSSYRFIKSVVKVISAIFVGILTLQNIVSNSADNLAISGTKMLIDTCVPIVGGAVSDAFSTVRGCLNLLKSGVGAFGIIAGIFTFIPLMSECIIWVIFLGICEFLSDAFDLKKPSLLFKSTSEIVKTLIAVLSCVIVVLISSSGIIMIIGG